MIEFRFGRVLKVSVLSLGAAALLYGILIHSASVLAESLPNTESPAGFSLTKIVDGLNVPTSAKFSPDGRIFVAEKGGVVKVIKNGQVLAEPFYVVPNVNDYVDRGLLGLTLDPDFSLNGYVYLLYTYDNNPSDIAGPKTGRLLRVTADGDKARAGSEVVLLGTNVGTSVLTSCSDYPKTSDCLPADGLSHAPGAVEFGPDKKLYVTIGDAAGYDDVDPAALNAQDLDNLAGKILRINRDGTAPTDNPYYAASPTANKSKVFAYGIRNAFRLSIRQSDGLIVVGDVGWNTWEEVNVVPKGGNLGWPCYEARDQQNGTGAPGIGAYKDLPACQAMYATPPANLVWPIHFYPHPPSSAVVSGVFYDGTNYPAEYKGLYFYGDYAKNQIYSLQLAANNTMVTGSNKTFASNAGGPVNFFTGPNGDIYYLAINMGGLYHITYSTSNQAPTAFASSDITYGPSPLTVKFSSNGSSDPEGDVLTYSWNFGDGSPVSQEMSPTHTFVNDGTYTVSLTVTDAYNNTSTKTLSISAGVAAPEVQITTPTDMMVADPEQVINFSGSATDVRDGSIPAANLRWQSTIYHCPLDSCHIHNMQTTTGPSGSFIYPNHDGPFYIQLSLTATNSSGLSSAKNVSVYPKGQPITRALQFDGINDYAFTAQAQDFRLQNFTVEAMVKTLSTDDWGSEVISMGNNWSLRVRPNGNLQFSFWSAGSWQNLIANVNVKDGLWNHVAVVKAPNGIKIYVNGAAVAQNENSSPVQYEYGNEFVVGRHGDGDDRFSFNGAIDEVRIWTTVRTETQIQQYRTTTLPSGQTGLLAYYDIEGGSGNTVADKSTAASHTLTLQGGATWTAGAPLSAPTTPNPTPTTPPITDLKDSFTGTILNAETWAAFPATSQARQNDQLSITPVSSAAGYSGIVSKKRYGLNENAAFLEVAGRTSPSTTAETQFILELNAANNISLGVTGTSLHMRHRINSVNSDTFIPYDAAAMRWWRIREAGETVYLETSPTGSAWTARRTFTKAFDTSKLLVILQAGTWQSVATPGTAVFDNLNSTPPTQPPVTTNGSLGFDGTALGEAKVTSAGQRIYAYQSLTVEAWVNVSETGIYGGEVVSNGNNYGIRILPDGNIRFFIHTGNLVWRNYETTGVAIKKAGWQHIAITKSGTTVNIYINGALSKSFASPEQITYSLGTSWVTGRHGDADNQFNMTGKIDSLRVWNIERTASDIASNYQKAAPSTSAGLIGSWAFNGDRAAAGTDGIGTNHFTLNTGVSLQSGYPHQ